MSSFKDRLDILRNRHRNIPSKLWYRELPHLLAEVFELADEAIRSEFALRSDLAALRQPRQTPPGGLEISSCTPTGATTEITSPR